MNRSFWFGYFCCFVLSQVHMDMMGKELYIKRVNEFWMDTNVWMWLGVFICGLAFYTHLEVKEILK